MTGTWDKMDLKFIISDLDLGKIDNKRKNAREILKKYVAFWINILRLQSHSGYATYPTQYFNMQKEI